MTDSGNIKNRRFFILLCLALFGLAAAALFTGPAKPDLAILFKIRLTRILAAALAGAALACAGALMQAVLRNPLADPYILGTSSGAALGVIAAAAAGAAYGSPVFYLLLVAGGFAATVASYFMARADNRTSPLNLLLSGLIVSTFAGSAIMLFIITKQNEALSLITFMMGQVTETTARTLACAAGITLAGAAFTLLSARRLDIIVLGEEKAAGLGLNPELLKIQAFAAAALLTGAAVSLAGTIGFVGLIAPHMARLAAGPSHRRLIPAAAASGAIFLLAADTIGRTIAAPREIPAGILAALVGAPFFLWLLKFRRGSYRF